MEKTRRYLEKKSPDYWDIRKEERITKYLKSEKEEIQEVTEYEDSGTGIRTLENGSVGFSYTEDNSKSLETSKESFSIANKLENQGVKFSEEEKIKDTYELEKKKPEMEELKEILLQIDSFQNHPEIKYSKASINLQYPETTFINSEGSRIKQSIPMGAIRLELKAKENSSKAEVSKSRHLAKLDPDTIIEKGREVKKEVLKIIEDLLKAEKIPSKKRKVIIDNEMTGLFAHEALGHALEADQENSCLADKKQERIAPREFNLVSDPTRKRTRGFYKYDNEGVKGKKTKLVDKGVLKSFMHSRETAGKQGRKSTGNGRAEDYSYPPIVRMNNTVIPNGNQDAEEMIEETKKGLLIKGFKGGNVHPSTGEFRFRAQIAYKIREGELKDPVRGILLSGKILELLETIEEIGNNSEMDKVAGFCGKDMQNKEVASGAPYIKLKNFMVS